MTTHEQLERKIAELHEKMFALQKEIEGVESELVKAKDAEEWPQEDDKYFYIRDDGCVDVSFFTICDDNIDTLSIGNMFRTKQEAEFTVERLKVLAEMRKFAFEPDWNDVNMHKYIIVCERGMLNVRRHQRENYGTICFPNEAAARDCISAIGEERLKKYYFGVKDDERPD